MNQCCFVAWRRWEGENGPRNTDWVATRNLIDLARKAKGAQAPKRFVLVSSVGVERYKEFPFAILNLFGGSVGQTCLARPTCLARRSTPAYVISLRRLEPVRCVGRSLLPVCSIDGLCG